MNSEMLIERISDHDLLQSDEDSVWEKLISDYPYAAILQQLNSKRQGQLSRDEIRFAALYKNDNLLFAQLFKDGVEKSLIEEEPSEASLEHHETEEVDANESVVETAAASFFVASAVEAVDNEKVETASLSTESEVIEETIIEPEEVSVEEQKEISEEEAEDEKEEIDEEVVEVEAKDNLDVAEVEKIQVSEEVKLEASDDDDILQTISSLPEQNALDIEAETLPRPAAKKEVEEVVEIASEPKDLMVMMSFLDWLHYFKNKKQDEAEDEKGRNAIKAAWQKEKLSLALEDDNEVVPEPIFKQAMASISFEPQFVTESYAELLVKQGKMDAAREMYRKLSLRNPEKSAYFASKIKELHSN